MCVVVCVRQMETRKGLAIDFVVDMTYFRRIHEEKKEREREEERKRERVKREWKIKRERERKQDRIKPEKRICIHRLFYILCNKNLYRFLHLSYNTNMNDVLQQNWSQHK